MNSIVPIKRAMIVSAALVLLTLVAYWPVLHADFISYDDRDYVTANAHLTSGLTWENAAWHSELATHPIGIR